VPSLYIHIPFCKRKCQYCDFYSVESTGLIENFFAALSREIALRRDDDSRAVFQTIYFGGGTPSLLTSRQLESILSQLNSAFRIDPQAELTLEVNPGTATREQLRAYRGLGVNRLSLGIQSFHDPELQSLGRIHDRAEALRCVERARAAGFENVGIDLINSIPGQTPADWEDTLKTATDLLPQHIAAYSLTFEQGTPLSIMMAAGKIRPNSPDLEAQMYERTMDILARQGYEHYEVSNYALPGFRCRHNWACWSHEDYLGLGPSAHSFSNGRDGKTGKRWWNVSDLVTYLDRLSDGALPIASKERLGLPEMISERIFLSLRSSGLDLERLCTELGYDLERQQGAMLQWLVKEELAQRTGPLLSLTPRGYVVCDEICRRLLQHVARSPSWSSSWIRARELGPSGCPVMSYQRRMISP
jgi:oxygen-independent coproporphyrinogen-3 oxidase